MTINREAAMTSFRPQFKINLITIMTCVFVVIVILTGLQQHDPVGMVIAIAASVLFSIIVNLALYGWFIELTQTGITKVSFGIFRQSICYKEIGSGRFDYLRKFTGQRWPGFYAKTILEIYGKDGSLLMTIPTRSLSKADVSSIKDDLERHGMKFVES